METLWLMMMLCNQGGFRTDQIPALLCPASSRILEAKEMIPVPPKSKRRSSVQLTKICTDFARAQRFALTSQGNPEEQEPARYGAVACSLEPSGAHLSVPLPGVKFLALLDYLHLFSLQGKRWKKRRRPSQPTPVVWPREALVREYVRSTGFVESHVGQQARR